MAKRLVYYIRQLLSYYWFGRRVYVFGKFALGNRKNIKVGSGCSINEGAFILGFCDVNIGNDVTLSARCMLIDSGLDIESRGNKKHIESFIKIDDNVWVGAGSIVLPGVTIGKGAVVGAGSVVTRDVPPNSVVAGNPARVIKYIE